MTAASQCAAVEASSAGRGGTAVPLERPTSYVDSPATSERLPRGSREADDPRQEKIMTQYCWAPDAADPDVWHGPYATRDEAHISACEYLAECCEPGTVTRYQTARCKWPHEYLADVSADWLADDVVVALQSIIGEAWGWEDPPIALSPKSYRVLAKRLLTFVARHNLSKQFGAVDAQTHEYLRPEAV